MEGAVLGAGVYGDEVYHSSHECDPHKCEPCYTEMLDGVEIMQMASPAVNHGVISGNIVMAFKRNFEGKTCRVFFGNVDVFLTPKDTVVPDLMIVCNRDIIKSDGIHGPPDLIVEILSPSTSYMDRGYKMGLYARCAVKEYWLVSPRARSVDIYALQDGQYVLDYAYQVFEDFEIKRMTQEDRSRFRFTVTSPTFPDMQIELDDIFNDMI